MLDHVSQTACKYSNIRAFGKQLLAFVFARIRKSALGKAFGQGFSVIASAVHFF
jgi:hypothetical protein